MNSGRSRRAHTARRSGSEPCTLEEIRRGLVIAAHVVEHLGDRYLPILDRLEHEYEAAIAREPPHERARRILAALGRDGDLKI